MNSSAAAASAYRQSSVESAPPIKIIHMLYDGAIRFLRQAQAIDPKADRFGFQEKIRRADAIVCELRLSLDPTHAPEFSEQISTLYLFVEDQLRAAEMESDPERIEVAVEVLQTLLDGWKQIEVDLARNGA